MTNEELLEKVGSIFSTLGWMENRFKYVLFNQQLEELLILRKANPNAEWYVNDEQTYDLERVANSILCGEKVVMIPNKPVDRIKIDVCLKGNSDEDNS
jgi:hypothetical protein